MPYKKELAKKRKLSPSAIVYLTDDQSADDEHDFTLWCYRHGMQGMDHEPKPDELWRQYRDEFLPTFILKNPGKRPLPWWQWDAPRWQDPFDGVYFHGTLPEPRLRIGGIGTPDYEVLNYVPSFVKGIPTGWVSKFDEEYYSGRRKDIHGNPIGTEYKEGHFKGKAIDPENPPVFESETAYLQRHGLLTDAEKKFLEKHPELMDPEKIEIEAEE